MPTAETVHRVIRDKVNSFQDECDLWKQDYKAAQLYFDFCDLLKDGAELHKEICKLDENWRLDIYRGVVPFDPEMDQRIGELFRRLAGIMFTIERDLLPHFDRESDVDDAGEFIKICRELRGILTDDKDFFADDALIALRDDALDQHAGGQDIEQWPT